MGSCFPGGLAALILSMFGWAEAKLLFRPWEPARQRGASLLPASL
jgi:hypothetical protein